ncbi:MAG: hypothetical protein ACYCSQ_05095 [bacterium]
MINEIIARFQYVIDVCDRHIEQINFDKKSMSFMPLTKEKLVLGNDENLYLDSFILRFFELFDIINDKLLKQYAEIIGINLLNMMPIDISNQLEKYGILDAEIYNNIRKIRIFIVHRNFDNVLVKLETINRAFIEVDYLINIYNYVKSDIIKRGLNENK